MNFWEAIITDGINITKWIFANQDGISERTIRLTIYAKLYPNMFDRPLITLRQMGSKEMISLDILVRILDGESLLKLVNDSK